MSQILPDVPEHLLPYAGNLVITCSCGEQTDATVNEHGFAHPVEEGWKKVRGVRWVCPKCMYDEYAR